MLLKPLLESSKIVKQVVGAGLAVKTLLKEHDLWNARPNALLDLRGMALELYPELFTDSTVSGMSQVAFLEMMVKELLGKDFNSSAGDVRVRVSDLRGSPVLEGPSSFPLLARAPHPNCNQNSSQQLGRPTSSESSCTNRSN